MSCPRTTELAADPRVRRGMEAQLAGRERRLAGGETSLGWKLGFGSAEAMEGLGITAPLVGFLTDDGANRFDRHQAADAESQGKQADQRDEDGGRLAQSP